MRCLQVLKLIQSLCPFVFLVNVVRLVLDKAGGLPVVRSMKGPAGSGGREMPMAFLMPCTLLTSHGVTWPVSSAKFSVTFSAADRIRAGAVYEGYVCLFLQENRQST